jgi:hypothetical protein
VDRETFLLLSALHSGASVSEAVTLAFEKTKLDAEEQANVLREFRARLSIGLVVHTPCEGRVRTTTTCNPSEGECHARREGFVVEGT